MCGYPICVALPYKVQYCTTGLPARLATPRLPTGTPLGTSVPRPLAIRPYLEIPEAAATELYIGHWAAIEHDLAQTNSSGRAVPKHLFTLATAIYDAAFEFKLT